MTKNDIIIDLRSLNFVTVNGETNLAHVGGGANFGEIAEAGYESQVQMGVSFVPPVRVAIFVRISNGQKSLTSQPRR